MQNSFAGLRTKVGNLGCRAVIAEMISFRKNLTLKAEFDESSGWNDPLNQWMADELGRIRRTIGLVSTQKALADQEALNAQRKTDAANEDQTLKSRYSTSNPITADDIQLPSSAVPGNVLPYDFSGADPDIPQVFGKKNTMLVEFCTQLDIAIKETTRLDCQGAGQTIPLQQGAMIVAMLDSLFTILQEKGGQANRRDIADGTSRSQDLKDDVLGDEIAGAQTPGA